MKLNVQTLNFTADQKLIDFLQEKMDKLDPYFKIISADVYLKFLTTGDPENKTTEIILRIPGDDIMVKRTTKTFEEGIDEGASTLRRQLVKRKEKLSARV